MNSDGMGRSPRDELLAGGPPIATYSIIGLDPEEDLIGVAVQSHYFAVGSMAPWAEPGVGAVIIQSIPKMRYDYGLQGLRYLRQGAGAEEALRRLVERDEHRDYRQVALAGVEGPPVNFTGESCVAEAGQARSERCACQANMMANPGVPEAMKDAFTETEGRLLSERLLAALRAAEALGGDLRGGRAAALMMVKRHPEGHHLEDVPFDLRVDDHDSPLDELERLVRLKSAFRHGMRGDAALVRGDYDLALEEYRIADDYYAGQPELLFWRSLALLNQGREEEALPTLKELFQSESKWATLFERASDAGLIKMDEALREWLRGISENGG